MQTTANNDDQPCPLRGLVTDQDLELAEQEFPGICELHRRRGALDRTFLDLLAAYLCVCGERQAA
jgi:hypothetical protein